MGSTPIGSRCVRCGFCCKQAPCPWGKWDDKKQQCAYLERQPDRTYLCSRYTEIITSAENTDICPAFGAGCSSPLFNVDRNEIIIQIMERATASIVG